MKIRTIIIFLGMAIVFNSFMDVFDFRFARDSGFWSIDSSFKYGIFHYDAWHLSKQLMLLCFLLAAVWKRRFWKTITVAFILISFFLHQIILHGIF